MSDSADTDYDTPSDFGGKPTKSSLKPVEKDGIRVVWVGILFWTLVLATLLLAHNWLTTTQRTSWYWISVSGIFLGFLGQIYLRRRRNRIERTSLSQ